MTEANQDEFEAMTEYTQRGVNFQTASEHLRLALPLMSKRRIPVVPVNYAVWYEYVAGTNPDLKQTLDDMLSKQDPVDESVTQQLYKRYIETPDQSRNENAQATIRKIIETVTASLEAADNEVTRYEQSLQECAAQLSGDIRSDDLRDLVAGLIDSTQQMHDGNAMVHRNLEESRQEADALRAELEQVRVEARTDPMTALANRKGFTEALDEFERSERYLASSHCLLIGDIDLFKSINDTYGHLFGDKVIKAVAKAIFSATKDGGLAARFGGEEFVVLLPETDLECALRVAESLRSTVERCRLYNPESGKEIGRVTISVGVTEIVHGEAIDDTIARADAALYRAKHNGRNRVDYDPPAQTANAAAG